MTPRKLLLVVGVTVAVGWVLIARLIAPGTTPTPQTGTAVPSDGSSEVVAERDPERLADEKNMKKRLVRQFVASYYERDVRLYEGSLADRTDRFRTRLRPYVSDDFLRQNAELLDIPQEAALIEAGGSVRARIVSFDGGHDLEVPATVLRTVSIPGTPPQRTETSLMFTLIEAGDGWAVDAVTPMV